MNGYRWQVYVVSPDDPKLVDRTGYRTVATTEPSSQSIYLSDELTDEMLPRVMVHELAHAALFSYYLVDDIHSVTKREKWVFAEEMICNFMANYGWKILQTFLDYSS